MSARALPAPVPVSLPVGRSRLLRPVPREPRRARGGPPVRRPALGRLAPGRLAPGRLAPGRLASAALAVLLLVLCGAPPARAAGWVVPLGGPLRVTRPFAPGPQPWSPGHRGADLAGTPGQDVLAAGDGRVTFAGPLAGRGVVVVEHGALRTTYEPVDALVAVGQPVAAGQPVGRLVPGHPGCPAAACLHWGLRRGDAYLDPLGLVRPAQVRLLPVGAGTGPTTSTRLGAPGQDPPADAPAAPASVTTSRPASRPAAAGAAAPGPRPASRLPPATAPVLAGLTVLAAAGSRRGRSAG